MGQSYNSSLDVHTLELKMTKRKPAVMVPVIVLELDEELDVDSRLVQQENGEVILPALLEGFFYLGGNYLLREFIVFIR